MDMTAPVMKYRAKNYAFIAFMIPFKFSGKAPAPTNSELYLYTAAPQTVYVR